MTQKEPEKKMPSTAANAIMRLVKLALVELHHLRAQLALRWTHGTILMAWSRCSFSFWILDVCVNEEGVRFALDVFDCNLKAIEALGFGGHDFGGEVAA